MQQPSILPFLQRTRPERPGEPYHSKPKSTSGPDSPEPSGQNRGPTRRRNMDLKRIADETKAELPNILAPIPALHVAQSSLYNLRDLTALDRMDCPGFVLPFGDTDAGANGTRIRVVDMDTFDAALQVDPNYKVHTHLGMQNPPMADNDTTIRTEEDIDDASKGDPLVGNSELNVDWRVERDLEYSGRTDNFPPAFDHHPTVPSHPNPFLDRLGSSGQHEIESSRKDSANLNDGHSYASTNKRSLKPVVVLNLASERSPGGGWQNGALAQEECLCYRSSLYLSLHRRYYPLPSVSAIYTPSVVLIRDAMSRGHNLLTASSPPENLPVTSVISVAALRKPQLADDRNSYRNAGQRAETKRKIRLTLRVAALNGHTKLVLGALGCGVFSNPPKEVAECFLEVLREKEFQGGWWEAITFAVLDNVRGAHGGKDGDGNFGVFYRVLHGQVV